MFFDKETKSTSSTELKSPTVAPTVFLVSVSATKWLNQRRSGDLDYAVILQKIIETTTQRKVVLIRKAESAGQILQSLKASSPPAILHLLINPHIQQNCLPLLTPEDLKRFKQEGIKIVITAVEFAKHTSSPEGHQNQSKILSYLEVADEIIFLNENDKTSAVSKNATASTSLKEKLQHAHFIAVPCTVPVARQPLEEKDITSREKDPALNKETEQEIIRLVKAELSEAKIADKHNQVYFAVEQVPVSQKSRGLEEKTKEAIDQPKVHPWLADLVYEIRQLQGLKDEKNQASNEHFLTTISDLFLELSTQPETSVTSVSLFSLLAA